MDMINKISKWGIPVTTLITFFCFIIGLSYHNGYCNWYGIKVSISELNFNSILLMNYYSLGFIFAAVCSYLLTTFYTEYKSLDKTFKPLKDISKEIPDMVESAKFLNKFTTQDLMSFFKNKDLMGIFIKITEMEDVPLQYLKNKTNKEILSIPKSEFISIFKFPNDIINKCDDINYNILLHWLIFMKGTLTYKIANATLDKHLPKYVNQEKTFNEKYISSKLELIIGIVISIGTITLSILGPFDAFEIITLLLSLMVGVLIALLNKSNNLFFRLITIPFCISILLGHSYASGNHSAQYLTKPNIAISTKSKRANKELFNVILRTNRGYYLRNQKSDNNEILFIPDAEIISIKYYHQ